MRNKIKKIRHFIIGIGEYLISAAVIFFIVRLILSDWDEIKDIFLELDLGAIIASLIIFIFSLFIQALAWLYLVKKINKKVRLISVFDAFFVSNLVRYIPGNIWGYMARIRLHAKIKVPSQDVLYLSLVETIFLVISSWVVFLASFLFWQNQFLFSYQYAVFIIFSLLLVIFVLYSPRVIKWFAAKYMKGKKINFSLSGLTSFEVAKILLIYILFWIINGLSLYFAVLAFSNLSPLAIVAIIGINAAAWCLGYVTFVTPSGVGPREAAIVFLLLKYLSAPIASTISILYRIISVISELVAIFAIKLAKKIFVK